MARKLFALLIGVLLCGLTLYAQVNATGSLVGTVTDKSGAVVPNASVKISSKDTGATREASTNGSGQYRFDLLASGTYELKVSLAGFANATFQNVTVAVSQVTTVDVNLAPSSQAETVVVEATGVGVVEMDKTDVSRPITNRDLQDLPLNGRDFVNLAYLAPGARPVNSYDPTKNRIGVFAVDGSNGRNVNVTVNGIDDKDNTVGGPVMQLPLEAVEEFKISTQRFSAANGRSEGAALTAITKSGTNDLHGSLYLFDRNEALNANDYFSAKAGNSKSPYSRQQFGGSIGGPVRKDKDFLFFTLEREREATNIVVDPTLYNELVLAKPLGAQPASAIPTPYFDWRYNGRWDHRFNDRNSMFVSYTNQNNTGQNDQSGSANDLTAGNFTTNQLILASVNFSSVLTPTVVNSATIGYQYWNNLIDSQLKVPTVTFASGETFGTNGNVPQQSFQKKWQFKDDLSITHGKHNFKMGFDYLKEPTLGGFFEFTPTPAVTFSADPSQILGNKALYPQGFATPGLITNISETSGNPYFILSTNMFGLYFQDDWKVTKRLTLNLGMRWDKDFNLVAGQVQAKARAYQELKAIGSPYAGIPQDDNKDFSPRIGFAYDLTGHGRHILRGGFGLYYGQIFENITLFMIQQANPTIFATVLNLNSTGPTDPNADIVPSTGKPLSQFRYGVDPIPVPPPPPTSLPAGSTGRLIDPAYHNPYTEQSNLGYSFAINDDNVVEIDYTHVLSLRESKSVQINPKSPNFSGRLLDNAFRAAGQPVLGSITDFASVGRSRYDGLNVAYRHRFSRHFSMNTSYVLSKAQAYNGSAANFGQGGTDPSNIFAAHDFGPTPVDERHRWVTSGVVVLPWGIEFSPIMQWASARPYSAREGTDYFGVGNGSTTDFAVTLNSDPTNLIATKAYSAAQLRACLAAGTCSITSFGSQRGTPFYELDARFTKGFKFRDRYSLKFFFQAFNLTNRANFGATYQGNIRSAQFGQPTGFITPSSVIIPQSFVGEGGFTFRF
ncbi:MAG TPA: TonB-dependent receptor [Bryobacteraceae bacterium]|nr:TonB-dependent receptor [Bryobacteraceae bacterium]